MASEAAPLPQEAVPQPPDTAVPKPLPMRMRGTVRKVIQIDGVAQTFSAELFLDIRVPMNLHDGVGLVDQQRLETDYLKWVTFLNAEELATDSWTIVEDAQAQEWQVQWSVKGKFLESMELHDFPLDTQELSFLFTVNRSMSGTCPVTLAVQEGLVSGVNIKRSAITNVWELQPRLCFENQLSDASESGARRQYPIMKISCLAMRQPVYYHWNVVCPMFCYVVMAGMSYCVDRADVADRLSVSVTLVLTAAAYKFVVASMVPALGYSTLLDKYVLVCFLFLFLLVVENALVGKYGSDEVDFAIFVVLASTFAVANTYFLIRTWCLCRERAIVAAAYSKVEL